MIFGPFLSRSFEYGWIVKKPLFNLIPSCQKNHGQVKKEWYHQNRVVVMAIFNVPMRLNKSKWEQKILAVHVWEHPLNNLCLCALQIVVIVNVCTLNFTNKFNFFWTKHERYWFLGHSYLVLLNMVEFFKNLSSISSRLVKIILVR